VWQVSVAMPRRDFDVVQLELNVPPVAMPRHRSHPNPMAVDHALKYQLLRHKLGLTARHSRKKNIPSHSLHVAK